MYGCAWSRVLLFGIHDSWDAVACGAGVGCLLLLLWLFVILLVAHHHDRHHRQHHDHAAGAGADHLLRHPSQAPVRIARCLCFVVIVCV